MRRKLPERPLFLCQRNAGSAQKHRDDAGVQYWERACELHRGLEQQGNVSALNSKHSLGDPGLPAQHSCHGRSCELYSSWSAGKSVKREERDKHDQDERVEERNGSVPEGRDGTENFGP